MVKASTILKCLASPSFAIGRIKWRRMQWWQNRFARLLKRGVIHVGANDGAEADSYAAQNLNVLWIEPIPEVFDRLQKNIAPHATTQRAVQALVTEHDNELRTLHVANGSGTCSSTLPISGVKDICPHVEVDRDIVLTGYSLPTLLDGVSLNDFDGLVVDTEGTEIAVLRGASPILSHFSWVQVEAADFETYVGCCLEEEVTALMKSRGFRMWRKYAFRITALGRCQNVIYRRL